MEDISWIAGSPPESLWDEGRGQFRASRFDLKIRHGPKLVQGTVQLTDLCSGDIKLDHKDGGLAPGQYVAFYEVDGSECFGGGVISERHWAKFLFERKEASANGALTTS